MTPLVIITNKISLLNKTEILICTISYYFDKLIWRKTSWQKNYKTQTISLHGNRRLINACRKAGFTPYNPRGPFNGYGYKKLPMAVDITSVGEMRKFNKIKKEVDATAPVKRPVKTYEEKKREWAKRLSKLTGITAEEAIEIAEEKMYAHQMRINDLIDRENERGYSVRREKLIRQLERQNPLRYIKDQQHADQIISAHYRHTNSEYDDILEEIHELEEEGMEKGYARELARLVIRGVISMEDIYDNQDYPQRLLYPFP